jgi:hypothetical protein
MDFSSPPWALNNACRFKPRYKDNRLYPISDRNECSPPSRMSGNSRAIRNALTTLISAPV